MATTVTYKGQTLTTVENQTKTLQTAGTWCEDDFTLTDVTQGGSDMLPTFIANQNVGSYTFNVSQISDYQFVDKVFTYLSLPNVVTSQKDGVFRNATIGTLEMENLTLCRNYYFNNLKVQTLNIPNLVTCGSGAFEMCNIDSLNLPEFVNCTGQTAFKNMPNLLTAVLPSCTTPGNWSFERCTTLQAVDFTALSTIPQGLFNYCTALDSLILRNTTAVTLQNVNAFNNMGGKAVTVYVPSSLVATYPTLTNWSSVTGATLTFASIEGSQYETQYADGTVIS